WVDADSSLPLRVIAQDSTHAEYLGSKERSIKIEAHFDYDPIPDEIFSTDAPQGYKLERIVYPEVMSGKVLDGRGNPVTDAQIYTSFAGEARTNENGAFALCKPPAAHYKWLHARDFPVFLRAFQEDNPNEVAWTIIRYPEWYNWHFHVRRSVSSTLRSEQEWEKIRQKWTQEEPEDTDGVKLFVRDEDQLAGAIGGDPGELFGNGYSSKDPNRNYKDDDYFGRHPKFPHQARDIVLVTGPAGVISGRVTNSRGKPIHGAVVCVEEMKMKFGKNRLFVRALGSERKHDWRTFAVTDENGRYRLGNLPAPWDKLQLEVRAEGYKVAPVEMTGGVAMSGQAQIVSDFDIQLIEQGRQDTELPVITHGRRPEVLFGRVVDERGKPVAGAQILTSIQAKGSADKDGNFAIKVPHSRISAALGGEDFPIFIHAFKKDDPDRVAWALLRNPKTPDSKPQPQGVTVRDIVLVMQPAGMVAGRIGDDEPVPNVTVWIESLEVKTGDEVITLGTSDSEWATEWWPRPWMPFVPTTTDKDGRYRFSHLPASWRNVKIRAMAKGYSTAQAEFGRHWEGIAKRCDFILFAR
ncbi:MAG: carboxypeptidase-like regulatory domain-containing protein, partial [Planctomycetota bacterium]